MPGNLSVLKTFRVSNIIFILFHTVHSNNPSLTLSVQLATGLQQMIFRCYKTSVLKITSKDNLKMDKN